MRRVVLAVVASGLLLTAAACSADEPGPTAAPAGGASAAASAAPAPSGPDAGAGTENPDTKKVCAEVMKVIETDMDGFGAAIGKMIANKEAKSADEAKKAQAAAKQQLESVAKKIRTSSAEALDPGLVAAGEEAADRIEKTAKDPKFFAAITSVESINGTLQKEMVAWVGPLAPICG
jgi:hypothetical protein